MLTDIGVQHVYLTRGGTDLRKSIDGLAAIVSHSFKLDLFSPCLFVFRNRRRDKLKILRWEHSGSWLYYRRLERGQFPWPDEAASTPARISVRELRWLLDGLSLHQGKLIRR